MKPDDKTFFRALALLLVIGAALVPIACTRSSASSQETQVQKEEPPKCPRVNVYGRDEIVKGNLMPFTVDVVEGDPKVTPTYTWKVSDGTIESGQGTASIQVNTSEAKEEKITATVEVGGFDSTCGTAVSATTPLK